MTKDFYNHMKEEQKLLYHSYQESLRQKNERMHGMDVWEPDDKTAENSQIKTLIMTRYQALKAWVVGFIPGF
jgi:hypothetical protein